MPAIASSSTSPPPLTATAPPFRPGGQPLGAAGGPSRPRKPRGYAYLRDISGADQLPRPNEFSLPSWITQCKQLLRRAEDNVHLDTSGRAKDGVALEEAYIDYRRAIYIFNSLCNYPPWQQDPALRAAKPELHALLPTKEAMDTISDRLKTREADWLRKYGQPPQQQQPQKPSLQAQLNGIPAPPSTNGHAPGPSNASPQPPSRPPFAQSVSGGPASPVGGMMPGSLEARLAALRSAGVAGASSTSANGTANGVHPSTPPTPGPGGPWQQRSPLPQPSPQPDAAAPTASAPRQALGRPPSPPSFNFPSVEELEAALPEPSSQPPPPTQPQQSAAASSSREQPIVFGSIVLPPSSSQQYDEDRNVFRRESRGAARPSTSRRVSSATQSSLKGVMIPDSPVDSRRPHAAAPRKDFHLPFTTEISPSQLYEYLAADDGPRVLLLDVRTRDEFERGRIIGDNVCIEPLVLRQGVTSSDIESSLTISPQREADCFASRHLYDVVVIYDRSSASLPETAQPSTASESRRVLWTLLSAIYEHEFAKSLRRQPIILRGGWEAWQSRVGRKGSVRGDGAPLSDGPEDEARKQANRRTQVLPTPNGSSAFIRPTSPESSSTPSNYFAAAPEGRSASGYIGSTPISPPPLARPALAASRGSFDYPSVSSPAPPPPSYPPQAQVNGTASPVHSPLSSMPSGPTPRERSDYSELNNLPVSNQPTFSYANTLRQTIDYPSLAQKQEPNGVVSPPTASAPPAGQPPAPAMKPQTWQLAKPPSVTRPAAAQPAPVRSGSASMGLPYAGVAPRFASEIRFVDEAIGLSGLKNLGNTCYMNSTIQCLSATIPFARYFKDGTYRRDVNTVNTLGTKGALADAVAELLRMLWAEKHDYLSPVDFRKAICRFAPQFNNNDQHDSQEFLGFLLDGLHEDLNLVINKPPPVEMTPQREKELETLPVHIASEKEWAIYRQRNDSFIVQCFQGQFRNQMRCLTCSKTSTTYNTFMPLSIPIPTDRKGNRVTLHECLKEFLKEEILDQDDAWFCPQCKTRRRASKKLSISRLPPILMIHLKRFQFRGPVSDKIETTVEYPLAGLDMTTYVQGKVYDLYGVSNHFGTLSSGHYTAFVRNHRDWYSITDSKFTKVEPHSVRSARSAYILYYRLR